MNIFVIFFLPALLFLGSWQVIRGLEKQDIWEKYSLNQSKAPINISKISDGFQENFSYRTVFLRGSYADRSVWLDNRIYRQTRGYEVFTPFISQDGRVFLVNRGWTDRIGGANIVEAFLDGAHQTLLYPGGYAGHLVGLCDLLEEGAQLGPVAVSFRLCVLVLSMGLLFLIEADHVEDLGQIEGFADQSDGMLLTEFFQPLIVVAGDQRNLHMGVVLAEVLPEDESFHARKVVIEKGHMESEIRKLFQTFFGGTGRGHLVVVFQQCFGDHSTNDRVIVDDQDMEFFRCKLAHSRSLFRFTFLMCGA